MPGVFDLILRVVIVLALILTAVLAGCLISVGGWFVAIGIAAGGAVIVTVQIAGVFLSPEPEDARLPRAVARRGGRAA